MVDRVREAIRRFGMLEPGDGVVVGLSGGADSCALLHVLSSLRDELGLKSISALHINHCIRGAEADRDAAFVVKFCKELGVKCRVLVCDIPALASETGLGLEECGRNARYNALSAEASACGGKIATAHTLSDSVETVLFNIIRGCSVGGLKGIPPVRDNIIRPLILCERFDTERYCEENGIDYVIDSSNNSCEYTRNRIRHEILPLMRELNPSLNRSVARLMETARTDDEYLCRLSDAAAGEYLERSDISAVAGSEPPVMSRALANICRRVTGRFPEQKHIVAMMRCLFDGHGSVNLPGDYVFSAARGKMSIEPAHGRPEKNSGNPYWTVPLEIREIITPYGIIIPQVIDKNKYIELIRKDKNVFKNCLDYAVIRQAAFRFRREGDRFSPQGRGITKSLRKLFNEMKIPSGHRCRLPILEADGVLAWICGIGVSERFKVTPYTDRVLYIDDKFHNIYDQGGFPNGE